MSTQTHSAGYTFVTKRPTHPYAYHVNLMLSSSSSTTVTETSHSTHALTKTVFPPRNFYEL